MSENNHEHVSERFRRLLALYRKPDGPEWGGQDLQNATGGAVTRSYVAKLEAMAAAMGFPPALWFEEAEERITGQALVAALKDGTIRSILEEAQKLRPKDRRLLLGIARQISPSREGG